LLLLLLAPILMCGMRTDHIAISWMQMQHRAYALNATLNASLNIDGVIACHMPQHMRLIPLLPVHQQP